VDNLRCLITDDLHNARMRMPEGIHADAGDHVEVLLAVHILDENALALFKDNREARIRSKKVLALEFHYVVYGLRLFHFHNCTFHSYLQNSIFQITRLLDSF
jgi:hypothetical protein